MALVTMRRAPGFAATALITLALGIGATTAVFSIVQGVLLRPLPYADSGRLVRLWEEYPGGASPAGNRWLSRSTYAVWREHARTLDALGGYALYEYPLAFGSDRFKVFGAQVSPAVLGTLGAAPALGRFLTDDDDREGAPRVVVVSDALWRERYGANPGVLGASLVIDGNAHTIVGVARPAFEFPDPRVRFWLPYVIPRSAAQPTGTTVFTALEPETQAGIKLFNTAKAEFMVNYHSNGRWLLYNDGWQYYHVIRSWRGRFGTGKGAEFDAPTAENGTYAPVWVDIDTLPAPSQVRRMSSFEAK